MATEEETIARIVAGNKSQRVLARPGEMEFGVMSVSDVTRDPVSERVPSEAERIADCMEEAVHAEEVGFDVYSVGEHHNPPFWSSCPPVFLAAVAARTTRLKLSTSTTLITTNDPVRIAEEYALLQH
ncbi:MAG: LLM class flavin-dependent oxidoreductase, partial [Bifidobacterium sp.]